VKRLDVLLRLPVSRLDPQRKLVLRQRLDHVTLARIEVGCAHVFADGIGLPVQFLVGIADAHPDEGIGIDGEQLFHVRDSRLPFRFAQIFLNPLDQKGFFRSHR
jgi:hypothetical protein